MGPCTIDERRHISVIALYGSHCDRGVAKSAIMFIKLVGLKMGGRGGEIRVGALGSPEG